MERMKMLVVEGFPQQSFDMLRGFFACRYRFRQFVLGPEAGVLGDGFERDDLVQRLASFMHVLFGFTELWRFLVVRVKIG